MLSLKQIDKLVSEVSGPDCVQLARLIIEGKENVSEFKLAEDLGLSINQIRNMLYRLQKYNLVRSIRKKDKKKGWYIYYWTFNFNHARSLFSSLKQNKLSKLRKRLEREESENTYSCSKNCVKLDLETAMDYNFKCPECNKLLKETNKEKEIELIKKEISAIEQELIEEGPEQVEV